MDTRPNVDPEIAAVLASLPRDSSKPLSIQEIVDLRELPSLPLVETPAVRRTDLTVPGDPELRIRVYQPTVAADIARPCIYWIHGGGYVMGTIDMADDLLSSWCERLDCIVTSIDYRLAPEHPYPTPLEDCYRGLAWVIGEVAALEIDSAHVGIGGVSAGGGLAAALGLLARDRGEFPLAFQLLACPMLDDRMITRSSAWTTAVWPPGSNRSGWQAYLGDLYGGDVPQFAAAARATDLAGLPPTLVTVGALDGFVDENVDYARRAAHAGVPVELHIYPGAPHGFEYIAPQAGISRASNAATEAWLARMVARA